MPIYDAAMRYKADRIPLVVFAGKEYGSGSSRDWAAKGTILLGVRAVVAQSFERIRSEERRVGKECRSLCDWSSDVCSSDLVRRQGIWLRFLARLGRQGHDPARRPRGSGAIVRAHQIGRASCRERV